MALAGASRAAAASTTAAASAVGHPNKAISMASITWRCDGTGGVPAGNGGGRRGGGDGGGCCDVGTSGISAMASDGVASGCMVTPCCVNVGASSGCPWRGKAGVGAVEADAVCNAGEMEGGWKVCRPSCIGDAGMG